MDSVIPVISVIIVNPKEELVRTRDLAFVEKMAKVIIKLHTF